MKIIGTIVYWISGIILFLVWMGTWVEWFRSIFGVILGNIIGFHVGLMTSPGILIFPLLYWLIEGELPLWYFFLWAIGLISFWLGTLEESSNREDGEGLFPWG